MTKRSLEKRTVLIVHEDVKTLGTGAELVGGHHGGTLRSSGRAGRRLTYPDTRCPFSQVLEQANLPDTEKIVGRTPQTGRVLIDSRRFCDGTIF